MNRAIVFIVNPTRNVLIVGAVAMSRIIPLVCGCEFGAKLLRTNMHRGMEHTVRFPGLLTLLKTPEK